MPVQPNAAVSLDKYELKPNFVIKNAVAIRHSTGQQHVHQSVQELIAYTKAHSLQPVSPIYNITYVPSSPQNDHVIEICMSVS